MISLAPHWGQIPFLPAKKDLTFSRCPCGQRNRMPINSPNRQEPSEFRGTVHYTTTAMHGKLLVPGGESRYIMLGERRWNNPHKSTAMAAHDEEREGPIELAFVGDVTDNSASLTDKLLEVPPGE